MTKRDMLYNKMMLGGLTIAELRELVRIEGVFSFGSNWLPIGRVRKNKDMLEIRIGQSTTEPDVQIPLDSVVKVQGNMVFVDLETRLINGGYMMGRDRTELRIRLDGFVFPEKS